ncbi:hypothetical protein ACFOVU_18105 [Nocardiopsis sediminis]|uniref:Uncharacterized protein n=1 Tax=Nocardiopsis sediminis TaxID=1778267 RepID=A0ABV8FNZ2_9ACTN
MAYRNVAFELAMLNRLRVRLEWLGFEVSVIESIAALRVTAPGGSEALWVSVNGKGQLFLWDGDFCIARVPASVDQADQVSRLFWTHMPHRARHG